MTQPTKDPAQTAEFIRDRFNTDMEGMSKAADDLLVAFEQRKRKIPEAVFIKHLLPIVPLWVKNASVDITPWAIIADGYNNELEVLDEQGKVLFILPPPFVDNSLPTSPPEGRFTVPHHLVQRQVDLVLDGDQRGAIEIDRALVDTFTPTAESVSERKARYVVDYIAIYERYNLPLQELLGPAYQDVVAAMKQQKAQPKKQEVRHDDGAEETLVY